MWYSSPLHWISLLLPQSFQNVPGKKSDPRRETAEMQKCKHRKYIYCEIENGKFEKIQCLKRGI